MNRQAVGSRKPGDSMSQTTEFRWSSGADAAVTLAFDDGYAATFEATVDRLHARDLSATYSVITDHVGSVFEGLPTATWMQWQDASRLGHEIASHSAAHGALAGPLCDLRRLYVGLRAAPDRRAYLRQLVVTAQALQRHRTRNHPHLQSSLPAADHLAASRLKIDRIVEGPPTESFAYPSGRHSSASRRAVAAAGFKSARTADLGLNGALCDAFQLRAVTIGPGLTVEDLDVWLRRARTGGEWLIIGFHLVAERDTTGYPYFCPLSAFQRLLDSLQEQPFWISTQRQVVRHLAGHNQTRSMGWTQA